MTAKQIGKNFVLLNGVNDVAYFGFLTLQLFLLVPTLGALLGGRSELGVLATIILIASQLVWQIFAEGPTGAFADRYGRARAIARSFWCRLFAMLLVVGCVLAGLTPNSPVAARVAVVALLILAQVLMATGEACLDGSIEAWLTDECKAADPEGHREVTDSAFERSAVVQNWAILLTSAFVLTVWLLAAMWGGGIETATRAGVLIVIAAALLCLYGAVIARKLSPHERHARAAAEKARQGALMKAERPGMVAAIREKLREAKGELSGEQAAPVRRLASILVLPFPCWIILSWFFTAFVLSCAGSRAVTTDKISPEEMAVRGASYALLLGVTLGIARVSGAYIGKWLGRRKGKENLQRVFEPAVFFNVVFLFGAAMLLVMRYLFEGGLSSPVVVALFLTCAALAKGSEEVIKLSKNKFLATAVPNDDVRATTLSFVSMAQNLFAFVAIVLSGLFAYALTSNDSRQPIIIFAVCATVGLLGWLVYRLGATLSEMLKRWAERIKFTVWPW